LGEKGKKEREKRGKRELRQMGVNYFVSLFNIGPYHHKKTGRITKNSRGGGKIFLSGHYI